ncbi:cupin domain-containing protein [Leucobacter denitrificans]|uniref:Cupin domain-containing protein n=1 Tax=Leucobacter denitrificans TaxID=683042 RepID=A0A7G9S7E6_9MICO|nr:cupin domain-containing protein [Leucobacter denitrificans]QNN63771.1 cupin domain-containing protein [Leucobacter denitrificans]
MSAVSGAGDVNGRSVNGPKPFTLAAANLDDLLAAAPVSGEKFQIKRIFQGTGVRMIRLTFAAGQTMREHSTNAPLVVQVLEGTVAFRIAGEELTLPAGAILHVEPSELHELEAVTDAHLLLTLAV